MKLKNVLVVLELFLVGIGSAILGIMIIPGADVGPDDAESAQYVTIDGKRYQLVDDEMGEPAKASKELRSPDWIDRLALILGSALSFAGIACMWVASCMLANPKDFLLDEKKSW